MSRLIPKLTIFLAAVLTAAQFFSSGLLSQPEFTEKILAVVNGNPITQTDVDEILTPIYLQYKNTYSGKELEQKMEIARSDILKQLIEDELMLEEAKRQELKIEDSEIDKLVNDLKANFNTPDEFLAVLENQNVSLNELRNRYRKQLLIKKVADKEVLAKIIISPSEISEYYEKNKEQYKIPEQVRLRNIFLQAKKENEAEVAKNINDIYEQLKKGAEFVELVEKYSQDTNIVDSGDTGFMKRGSMRKEIEDAVFGLKEGEFTPPIKTPTGYYIFRLEEKQPVSFPPAEQVQEKIRGQLYQQKVKEKLKAWVNALKNSALIEIKTDLFKNKQN
ncbi:MAG: peptidyl-prolyl cis-trans isomerase [Candidatus Omnitrophica bacterium]|nr:peptidyl-prolyl cis-trans isomerase [Candidatus Omnitrophota bacterium]